MSKYSIDSTTLTSVANAIRGKDGTSAPIQVSDFATRITNIPTGGGGGGSVTFTGWLGSLKVTGKVDTSNQQTAMAYIPPVFEVGDTVTLNYRISSSGTQRKYTLIIYKVTYTGGQTNKASVLSNLAISSGTTEDSYSFTVEEGEDYGYAIFLRLSNATAQTTYATHEIDITGCEVS